MSMIPVPQPEEAVFNKDMTALETTTPAYAPTFNAMFEQLLENDIALKESVDEHAGIGCDTTENIAELAKQLMEEGGIVPPSPTDTIATEEQIEEVIEDLHDL